MEGSSGDDPRLADLTAIDDALATLEEQRDALGAAVADVARAPLLDRRRTLLARIAGGRRTIATVLFADLVDFTVLSRRLDPEDVEAVVGGYFTRWERLITLNGGVVEKFIGDAVMAVFGLRQAREDDAESAIRAATAMGTSLAELSGEVEAEHGIGLAMRVGIATSEVVVTVVDDRPGQDDVVVGETANLASRLQAAASPGSILVAAGTMRLATGAFAFTPVGPLRLKGIDEPVAAFEVTGERHRTFRLDEGRGVAGVDTDTVGRDAELRSIQDLLATVTAEGRGRLVTIVGEPGVGKSRLLRDIDRWLTGLDTPVWWFGARADPVAQDLPNALLRDLMATRLGIDDTDTSDEVRAKWVAGMGRSPAVIEPARSVLLARWLGFELGDAPRGDAQALARRAESALTDYLVRLAERSPVVILLEDLHWADDGSLAFLRAAPVAFANSPVLVVAAARPDLFEHHPGWATEDDGSIVMTLEPLTPSQSRELLTEIFDRIDGTADRITDLVVDAADGNPFYIEELVNWMVESGVVERVGDRWRVHGHVEPGTVPPTLRSLLQARLDVLDMDDRGVVDAASVVGRVFWDDAVAAVRERVTGRGDDLVDSLERLHHRQLIQPRDRSSFAGTNEFAFGHALVRDVAYASVLRQRRLLYHRRAAGWFDLMAGRSRRTDEYAGLIAHHHDMGGEPEAAASWYLRAGSQALGVHALPEAARLLDRGIELGGDDTGLRFDLLSARAAVFDRLGERSAQDTTLSTMDSLAPRLDAARATRLLLAKADRAFSKADYRAQAELARRAAELAEGTGVPLLSAQALHGWGKALAWARDNDGAEPVLESALASARSARATDLVGETLRNLAVVADNRNDFPAALELLDEAADVFRQGDDPLALGRVMSSRGAIFSKLGRSADALENHESARRLFTEVGYQLGIAIAIGNVAEVSLDRGELGATRRAVGEGLELSRRIDDVEGIAFFQTSLGSVYRRAGMSEQADAALHLALDASEEADLEWSASRALLELALVAVMDGAAGEAVARAERSVTLADRAESPIHSVQARCGLGIAHRANGAPELAEAALVEAGADARRHDLGYVAIECDAVRAAVALDQGDPAADRRLARGLVERLDPGHLEGCLDPGAVYLSCWRGLAGRDADDDDDGDRARTVLRQAGAWLDLVLAGLANDADLSESFRAVRAHAELAAATGRVPAADP